MAEPRRGHETVRRPRGRVWPPYGMVSGCCVDLAQRRRRYATTGKVHDASATTGRFDVAVRLTFQNHFVAQGIARLGSWLPERVIAVVLGLAGSQVRR